MKKLHLDLESLQVESLVTSDAAEDGGTVYGRSYSDTHQISCWSYCGTTGDTCNPGHTCEQTCGCNTLLSQCFDCEI